MTDLPLVSIIIPVFNVELYLEKCLYSVTEQSYRQLEIIIIDDGSTDGSLNICRKFQKADSRVTLVSQRNAGLSAARNKGTEIANGNFLMYLDADDWINKDLFNIILDTIKKGDYDLVFWPFVKEYTNKSINIESIFNSSRDLNEDDTRVLQRKIAGPINEELRKTEQLNTFVTAWGKLYKTDIIRNNSLSFVDTKIVGSEDVLFVFDYLNFCQNSFYLHQFLYHYRKNNPASLSKNHGSLLFDKFVNLFQMLNDRITKYNLGEDFIDALNNRIAISIMNIGLSEVSKTSMGDGLNKIRRINFYLSNPLYKTAIDKLSLKKFRLPWKIFFYFAKKGFGFGLFLMLRGMRLLMKK